LTVEVEYLKDLPYATDDDNFRATTMEVVSTIQDLVRQNPLYQEHLKHFVNSGGDYNNASWLADLGATLTRYRLPVPRHSMSRHSVIYDEDPGLTPQTEYVA